MAEGVREGVRTQNLRDFTVQIRRVDNDAIVGTGIAVSTDGKIVTCAHVVRAAGVEPRNANGAFEKVFVPLIANFTTKDTKSTKEKPSDLPIPGKLLGSKNDSSKEPQVSKPDFKRLILQPSASAS
jgi:hypothetical protein